jgi:hypothetical protein
MGHEMNFGSVPGFDGAGGHAYALKQRRGKSARSVHSIEERGNQRLVGHPSRGADGKDLSHNW